MKDFYIDNRKKIVEGMEDNSVLVLFSGQPPHKSADEEYTFNINKNFYYFTGIERENIILFISKLRGKINERLFVEKSNPVLEKWIGKKMSREEATERSGIEGVYYINEFESYINTTTLQNNIETLYLDLERREWDSTDTLALRFAKDVSSKYPYIKIRNIYRTISDMRTFKSKEEIEKIKKAIDITSEGIKSLMKNAKAGMMEYQLEAYFDFTIKTLGAKEHAFSTIAASGKNATVLHYGDNNNRIEENSLILFDLGAQYDNYKADITRTFPVSGKFNERQKQIYNIVLKAELETMKVIKSGLPFKELNNVTKRVLGEELKKIGLIKEDSELGKYYYHGVSHYLGLDTHDVGSYDRNLEPGMVLTIEPGVYIEEEGIGVRIEDNVLVTEDGYVNLSEGIIKNVEDIEEFIAKGR